MATVQRLKQRADFVRATRRGRKWAATGLVLQAVPTPSSSRAENTVRLGFTASKRVGGAVTRNRVKRRLRAVAETVFKDRVEPHYDYVLIGRAQTATRPFSALIKDLETALKRLGRYQSDPDESKRQNRKASEDSETPLTNSMGNGTPSQ